jgi:tRNA threonylcarbamoyladenosine biosynthesis protein TsaB
MIEDKPILAIETSESLCSTAIYFSDGKYFQSILSDKHSHAEKLIDSIVFSLGISGVDINDLGSIAVSSGPGSFTGLRIGMSAAKGLALGAGLPIIAVPTFEALALQISRYLQDGAEFIIANKVNSEEIYYAMFKVIANKTIFVEELKVIKKTDFERKTSTLVFGNVFWNENKEKKTDWLVTSPDAVHIARWAKIFGKEIATYDFDYLEPDYHKNFLIKAKKKYG